MDPVARQPVSASSARSTTSENTYVANVVGQVLQKATASLGQGFPVPNTSSFTQQQGPSADVEKLETTPGLNQAESEVSLPMAADNSGDASKPTSPASGRQSRLADRSKEEEEHSHHDANGLVPPPTDMYMDKHPEEQSKDRQGEHGDKEDSDPPKQEDLQTDVKTTHRPSLGEHPAPDHSDTSTREHPSPSEGVQHEDDLQPEGSAQSEKVGEGPAREDSAKSTDAPSSHGEHDSELHKDASNTDKNGHRPEVTHLKEEQQPGEDQGKADTTAESSNSGAEQSQHAPQDVPQEDGLAGEDKERGSATLAGELPKEPPKNGTESSRDLPNQDTEQEKTEDKTKSSSTNVQTPLKTAPDDKRTTEAHQHTSFDQLAALNQSTTQGNLPLGSDTPKPVKPNSDSTLRSALTQGELNKSIPAPSTLRRLHSI